MAADSVDSNSEHFATLKVLLDKQFRVCHDDAFCAVLSAIVRCCEPGQGVWANTGVAGQFPQVSVPLLADAAVVGALRNGIAALATLGSLSSACEATKEADAPLALLHGREWWDAPEFQPVLSLKGGKQTLGLWRDDSEGGPVCVVQRASGVEPSPYSVVGSSLAGVLAEKVPDVPGADALLSALRQVPEPAQATHGTAKARKGASVGKTLDGMAVGVPWNAEAQAGWRPVHLPPAEVARLLARATVPPKLRELLTFAHIANDERDHGMPLQLGRDVWRHSLSATDTAVSLLTPTYTLLQRKGFVKLLKRLAAWRKDLAKAMGSKSSPTGGVKRTLGGGSAKGASKRPKV